MEEANRTTDNASEIVGLAVAGAMYALKLKPKSVSTLLIKGDKNPAYTLYLQIQYKREPRYPGIKISFAELDKHVIQLKLITAINGLRNGKRKKLCAPSAFDNP